MVVLPTPEVSTFAAPSPYTLYFCVMNTLPSELALRVAKSVFTLTSIFAVSSLRSAALT